MHKIVSPRILTVLTVTLFLAGPPAISQERTRYPLADLKALQQTFVDLADQVRPSVVAIRTYHLRKAAAPDTVVKMPHSQGSGFIIDPDGYIATNAHVIEAAQAVAVIMQNGLRYEATVLRVDPRSDLAILKVDAEGLPAVRWANTNNLRVNQWAFACGNPFGLANEDGRASITYGVISALGRHMTDRLVGGDPNRYYGNLIETSAAINPGSSGGPLFNIDGEVIGVVTAIETSSGVNEGHGFAIPTDAHVRGILDTLKTGSTFRYGYLGVAVEEVDPPESRRVADSMQPRGAKIIHVNLDGPAGSAGLQPNDIVTEYNGTPIQSSDHLIRLVGFTPIGSDASITYVRKTVKRKAVVTIADRPIERVASGGPQEETAVAHRP